MATTRAFKSGNSQAVRIPAEIAFEDGQELTIARHGDVVIISPKRATMKDMVAKLRAMPKPSSIEIYEPIEFPVRDRD
jgi:antitoxin VapB